MAGLLSGEPLRILLVSPHAEQREQVGEALQAAGEHRFFWISQPDLVLARASGLDPHVVLVDADLGGAEDRGGSHADPVALIRRLVSALPETIVFLLVEPAELVIAQNAVLAGARAFVKKPVRGDELLPVLRQTLGRRVAQPSAGSARATMGKVIVFCGPKGGTGRTTLAVNTAVALHEAARQPVVIVDADYAAPALDVALNLNNERDIRDLLPKLNQLDPDLISSVLATHSTGVRILLAPPPEALDYPPTLPQVQQVIAWLKRIYPWVIVDLGLPMDESAYAFLDASDIIIISILPDMVGMRNARLLLAQFAARNYPPEKVWPLFNRDGLRGGIPRAEAEAYLGRPMRFWVPNDQELATETINRGVPMVITHRRRPLSQAYHRLAKEILASRAVPVAEADDDDTDLNTRIRSAVTVRGVRPAIKPKSGPAPAARIGSSESVSSRPVENSAVASRPNLLDMARSHRRTAFIALIITAVAAIAVPLIVLLGR